MSRLHGWLSGVPTATLSTSPTAPPTPNPRLMPSSKQLIPYKGTRVPSLRIWASQVNLPLKPPGLPDPNDHVGVAHFLKDSTATGLLEVLSAFTSTSFCRPCLTVFIRCHLLSLLGVCPSLGEDPVLPSLAPAPQGYVPCGSAQEQVPSTRPKPHGAPLLLPTMLLFGTNRKEPGCSSPLAESPRTKA